MSVNEEVEAASSDSFWEVDQFRRTVKRVEDGLHMSHELSRLISERSELEREYAKKLQSWSKKWNEIIEKGPEYGTNKAILLGSLNEAEALADVHIAIRDKLLEVKDDVKKWRHETYKKQMVGGCKEAKLFEDKFRKAQRPWAKMLGKVQKCRKDFHNACKLEKTAAAQLSAEPNSDQTKKLQERLDKCRKDVESMKDKYEEALSVLHKYNATYVDDMTEVFIETQAFEEKRLRYFKDALVGIHQSLDISRSNDLPRIYDQLRQTINLSDASKDLKWWSQNHGVDMPMMWPVFEEYSTEPAPVLNRKDKTRSVYVAMSSDNNLNAGGGSALDKNGGIPRIPAVATVQSKEPAGNQREVASAASRTTAVPAAFVVSQPTIVPRQGSYDMRLNPFEEDDEDDDVGGTNDKREEAESTADKSGLSIASSSSGGGPPSVEDTRGSPSCTRSAAAASTSPPEVATRLMHASASPKKSSDNTAASSNPFDDDEDAEVEDFSNIPGVPVEALFDYTAQEGDELTFKQGDKFEKLKDKDDQGWCTGRMNGRVGLYPDNYVKLLRH